MVRNAVPFCLNQAASQGDDEAARLGPQVLNRTPTHPNGAALGQD